MNHIKTCLIASLLLIVSHTVSPVPAPVPLFKLSSLSSPRSSSSSVSAPITPNTSAQELPHSSTLNLETDTDSDDNETGMIDTQGPTAQPVPESQAIVTDQEQQQQQPQHLLPLIPHPSPYANSILFNAGQDTDTTTEGETEATTTTATATAIADDDDEGADEIGDDTETAGATAWGDGCRGVHYFQALRPHMVLENGVPVNFNGQRLLPTKVRLLDPYNHAARRRLLVDTVDSGFSVCIYVFKKEPQQQEQLQRTDGNSDAPRYYSSSYEYAHSYTNIHMPIVGTEYGKTTSLHLFVFPLDATPDHPPIGQAIIDFEFSDTSRKFNKTADMRQGYISIQELKPVHETVYGGVVEGLLDYAKRTAAALPLMGGRVHVNQELGKRGAGALAPFVQAGFNECQVSDDDDDELLAENRYAQSLSSSDDEFEDAASVISVNVNVNANANANANLLNTKNTKANTHTNTRLKAREEAQLSNEEAARFGSAPSPAAAAFAAARAYRSRSRSKGLCFEPKRNPASSALRRTQAWPKRLQIPLLSTPPH